MDTDNLPLLNLPETTLKISESSDSTTVFDILRQKYVALTPEEYVRQRFVNWLIEDLSYPKGVMNNEIKIELNGLYRRCDTVVFDKNGLPWMIIEYKAPSVSINQNTFNQIVKYNIVLKAKYLVVSNGISHYCCKIDYKNSSYCFINGMPEYNDY